MAVRQNFISFNGQRNVQTLIVATLKTLHNAVQWKCSSLSLKKAEKKKIGLMEIILLLPSRNRISSFHFLWPVDSSEIKCVHVVSSFFVVVAYSNEGRTVHTAGVHVRRARTHGSTQSHLCTQKTNYAFAERRRRRPQIHRGKMHGNADINAKRLPIVMVHTNICIYCMN